jgi:hypothetical protein
MRLPELVFPTMRRKRVYTDTLFAGTKSLRGHQAAQVWTDGDGFCLFFPMQSKAHAPDTIWKMIHKIQGIPETVVSDNQRWMDELNLYHMNHHVTEPYSPWQNKAEAEIREIKRMIKTHMYKSQCLKRFWCYCGEWVAAIRQFMAHNMPVLDGTNLYERIYAQTADIVFTYLYWYCAITNIG